MTETKKRPTYRDGNATADRALAILLMFSEDRIRVSALEVSAHLGVSRSTAYRYLLTLVGSSFLVEDAQGGFRLGSKLMELSIIARRSYGLSDRAVPLMQHIASTTHETVLLTKRVGSSIVCLEREEWTGRRVRLSYERGSQLSFNAGASAMCLLAWMDERDVRQLLRTQPLPRYTSATLTNPEDIIERLRTIRDTGYAIAHGEVDHNVVGIAAPVFGDDSQVVAAVSVVTLPTDQEPDILGLRDVLTSAASQLSFEQRLLNR